LFAPAPLLASAAPQTNAPPTAPPPAAAPNTADMREFHDYVLTMDKIRKLAAVEKDLDALQKNDPQLRQQMEADTSSAGDLNHAAQNFSKYPQAMAVLKKDGLTPREYIVGTICFIQAVTAVGFKKNGTYKDYPPQVLQVVTPVNLAFLEQHWDDVAKIMPTFADEGAPQNTQQPQQPNPPKK
jgi:hypothetical protein